MKKIILIFVIIFAVLVVYFGKKTYLFENLWGRLMDKDYIIPEESSMLTFNATEMNHGSGDYWLYGEDENYYYSTETGEKNPRYAKISKKDTAKFKNFDVHQISTWQKTRFEKYEPVSKNTEIISVKFIQWATTDRPNFILEEDYIKHKNTDNLVDYCFFLDTEDKTIWDFPKEIVEQLQNDKSVQFKGKFYKTKNFYKEYPDKIFQVQGGPYSFEPKDGYIKVFVYDKIMTR